MTSGEHPDPSLSEYFTEVLSYVQANLGHGTLAIYKNTFRLFGASVGDCSLRSLNPRHFDRYKTERLGCVKPSTVNIELRTLKAAFRLAVRWRFLTESPLEGVTLVRIPERQPVFFSREDFQRLLSAIQEDWLRDTVLFAAATGMRQGEILSLTWDKIDRRRKIVRVESGSSFKTKGGKMRSVPLSEAASGVLQLREGNPPTGYVFTLHGKPLKRRWVTTKLRRYIRTLKLDPRLNFHSTRHSLASWLALEGVSIYQISKILGHSDVKITQTYYAHLQGEELHDAINKINLPGPRNGPRPEHPCPKECCK